MYPLGEVFECDFFALKYLIIEQVGLLSNLVWNYWGIISLGFSNDLPEIFLKILAVVSLISTCYAIINQKEYEKITSYRKLANEYKKIYDESENNFHNNLFDKSSELQAKKDILSNNQNELTIMNKAYKKNYKK